MPVTENTASNSEVGQSQGANPESLHQRFPAEYAILRMVNEDQMTNVAMPGEIYNPFDRLGWAICLDNITNALRGCNRPIPTRSRVVP